MKNLTKNEILSIVLTAAKDYSEKLLDRHFLVIYQDRASKNAYKYKEIGFRDYNFLHLTGLKTDMSASAFFSAATSDRLSVNQFNPDKQGRCIQKLNVLPYLSNLLYNKCLIGDFINSGISIKADYFAGDTRSIISLGFRKGTTVDNPVSLYNEDIKKLSNPTNRVIAIFSKSFDSAYYESTTYTHEVFDLNTLLAAYPDLPIKKRDKSEEATNDVTSLPAENQHDQASTTS